MCESIVNSRSHEAVQDFAEELLNRYYLNTGEAILSDTMKNFILKIGLNSAGIFDINDTWNIITTLHANGLLKDEVLKESSIQRFDRYSYSYVNTQIKDEILDLASNKSVTQIDKSKSTTSKYITRCMTIPSLRSKIEFGNHISTIEYELNGESMNPYIQENVEGNIDFKIPNVLIKEKKDICNGIEKKYVRIILISKIDKE